MAVHDAVEKSREKAAANAEEVLKHKPPKRQQVIK